MGTTAPVWRLGSSEFRAAVRGNSAAISFGKINVTHRLVACYTDPERFLMPPDAGPRWRKEIAVAPARVAEHSVGKKSSLNEKLLRIGPNDVPALAGIGHSR